MQERIYVVARMLVELFTMQFYHPVLANPSFFMLMRMLRVFYLFGAEAYQDGSLKEELERVMLE